MIRENRPEHEMPNLVSAQIIDLLEQALLPSHLNLTDDSAHHHGHPEASARGGRHYKLVLVAPCFEAMTRLERERSVQGALAALWQAGSIHALSCKLFSPTEWAAKAP